MKYTIVIFSLMMVSFSIFAADSSGSDEEKPFDLALNLRLIDQCFENHTFNKNLFDGLAKTEFKNALDNSAYLWDVVEKPAPEITVSNFYDALVNDWFDRQMVPLILAGKLPEDGHDLKFDWVMFAGELAKCMKDAGRKLHSSHEKWAKFFGDEQNGEERLQVRNACPLVFENDTCTFVHDSLIEYFIVRSMYESDW